MGVEIKNWKIFFVHTVCFYVVTFLSVFSGACYTLCELYTYFARSIPVI